MKTASCQMKNYDIDEMGFLVDSSQWDEEYAEDMSTRLGIPGGLTEKHWSVINYIRRVYSDTGDCPLVYQTCRAARLSSLDFRKLFPTGYLRGACLLAGITYKDRFINYYGESGLPLRKEVETRSSSKEKSYRVDVQGFLLDATEWDEDFAVYKASDLKIQGGLTAQHWKIIKYLRDSFETKGAVPTIFECCDTNKIELDALERLFPSGYHRGAVKISGLRVR